MNRQLAEDHSLQRAVIAALMSQELAPANVGVTVHAGVVTLSGHVRNAAQKRAAQEAALQVDGVKAVALTITIRNIKAHRWYDDEIAAEAANCLAWDSAVPPGVVTLSVERGRLTLFGEFRRDSQRAAALEDVSRLFGVAGVQDRTTLKT